MCDCINKVNEKLKEYNTQIEFPIAFDPNDGMKIVTSVRISTVKIDTRKKLGPVGFFATYCPVCGEEYKQEE